jgi:hypothetical protein
MSGGISNGEGGNGIVEPDDGTGVFGSREQALARRPPEAGPNVELYEVRVPGYKPVYCWTDSVFEAVYRVAFVHGWRATPVA